MRQLFRRKSLDRLVGETTEPGHQLKRALGPVHLTLFGVGAIVGAGIFSTVGTAAAGGADHIGAGPAIIVSFLIMAPICALAGLCYAEFASMAPVSGSAYTYAYATMGELAAWIIGWDLILEYAVGNVAVAISWSGYFQALMHNHWPAWLGVDFRTALQAFHAVADATSRHVDLSTLDASVVQAAQAWHDAPRILGAPIIFNLPAFGIVILLTGLLAIGIKESAWFNSAMVVLKLVILLFFLVIGAFYLKSENWKPFAPHGFKGIASGAAVIFFAYIGFDAVSTAAEETRRPQRDMPIGILGSLGLCTVIYVAVAVVLTGMLPASKLDTAEPLATAFTGLGMNWAVVIISIGALLATASVLLVFQMGQSRIFFSMARDGLLPSWAASVHPRFRTPFLTTLLTGTLVAAFAGVMNIDEVVELCNIGTAFAFVLVAAGVIILRKIDPDRPRGFRTPWVPWVPIASIITSGWLMSAFPAVTWLRFVIWLAAGLVVYFCYGYRRSHLRASNGPNR
ncbi:MAG TPA: amino acid permease [Verrucomicrobiae bacterium]|jgi:APA family basic amino acid/polyamine antiporter